MGWNVAVFGLVFSIILFTGAVKADIWSNQTCVNGVETSLVCDGVCSSATVLFNHTETCRYGCNNDTYTCEKPSNIPDGFFALVILSLLAMAGLFALIAIKFNDDWGVMPLLFFLYCMIFIVLTVGVIASFFVLGQRSLVNIVNVAFYASAALLFVFIAYIIMRFMVRFAIKFMKNTQSGSH